MRFLFLPIRSLKPSLLHSFSRYSSLASSNPPPMDPTEAALRQALADKQAAADVQSAAFCSLKAAGAPKPEIAAAVDTLKALKLEFESVARELKNAVVGNGETSVNREAFWQAVVNTHKRRLFYILSLKIYRGVAGLYDYGPPGCAVKANVLTFWRQIATWINYRIISRTTFTISNVVGPQEEIMFAGNPIRFLRATSTSIPHALTMHMVSYMGSAEMQILVAKDIIPDPGILAKCFQDALLEMKDASSAALQTPQHLGIPQS